jgi:hypothetical protein
MPKMLTLFAPTSIPRWHTRNRATSRCRWLTWSPEFLRANDAIGEDIDSVPSPLVVSIRGCEPYAQTYSSSLSLIRPRSREVVFSGLTTHVNRERLHRWFALLRSALASALGDPRSCLYAPVKTCKRDDGFPLHSDLFLTNRLLLVFDDVPNDDSGKTLLQDVSVFLRRLRTDPQIPPNVSRRIANFFRGKVSHDKFNDLFELVHESEAEWSARVRKHLAADALRIKLRRGEGYLLHDRLWMHGRSPSSRPVRDFRFHRLNFGHVVKNRTIV